MAEKKVCGECGADVRPQTSFCYNCGKSVTETPDRDPADEPSSVWFGETITSDGPEPEPEPVEDAADAITETWEGPALAEAIADAAGDEPETVEAASDPAEAVTEGIESENIEPENIGPADIEPEAAPGPDGLDPVHHSLPVESGMQSAASIRRKPKTFQRREVEIVWEEYEGKSNLKYILITLLVVLFTVIVFWIAMTMR